MTPTELQAKAEKYRWYHPIDLGGYVTKPDNDFSLIWDFIRRELDKVDFKGKSVLDVGARDCLWSFYAEKRGANLVTAVDNNLSLAAVEVAIPALRSSILAKEINVYSMASIDRFDIVLMLGLLYHLRFPMIGLWRACECLKPDGLLCIETAIYTDAPQNKPMLYCPYLDSPYEAGSVSFFNRLGLVTTMESMGPALIDASELSESQVGPVRRAFFKFRKSEMMAHLREYWTGTHTGHTSTSEKAWQEEAAHRHVSAAS